MEGCAALAKLAHFDKARCSVSRLGGAKLAAAAVSSFANEPAVMEQVCWLIGGLARGGAAMEADLQSIDAHRLVVGAMKRGGDDAGVAESGCAALEALCAAWDGRSA